MQACYVALLTLNSDHNSRWRLAAKHVMENAKSNSHILLVEFMFHLTDSSLRHSIKIKNDTKVRRVLVGDLLSRD